VSVTVQTVTTGVPGSLGFLPDDHGIQALLRFEETDASLAPVEDLGALSAVRPVGAFPAVVDGYTSRARELDGLSAIQATDALGTLILDRTVSIVALIEWDHAATAGPDALLAHGVGGSAEERRSWHLRLAKPGGGTGRVQWVWEDRAGAEHAQGGGDFFLPASGFMMVAATREWCGDRFLLRYWIGETLLAELETTDMEVGGGIGATVTIGCVGDGLGGFEEYFHGRIDQVAILGAALTQAQVTHLWQRIAVWPQDLYAALRDLQPVGEARTRDPASLVQRRIRTQSGVLAATSALLQLRSDAGLPDRAYGPRLELWERTTGQRAHAADSVATRQARVLAALRGEQGLTAAALRENLAPLYGCDPEDFEILRFDNIARGIDYAAWAEAGDGAVLIDAPNDRVTLRVAAGAQYSIGLGGYSYQTTALTEALIACTVESTSLSNDDLFVGFATYAERTLAGIRLDTSAGQLVNTLSGANVQAYTLPLDLIVFLDDEGNVGARIGGGAAISLGAAPSGLIRAVLSLRPISTSVPGSARSATVSALFVQNLDSRQTQVGYLYNAEAVDLAGARRQLARQQPAHAFAAALTTRALRCDDLVNGLEQAPLVETALNVLRAMLGPVSRAWAGSAVDVVAGELLVAAGTAGVDASVPSAGPFGDQSLVLAAGTTDKWTLPSAAALNFNATRHVAFVLVYYISAFTLGTEYTLLGNREGGDLQGVEVAIGTSGNLLVRFDAGVPALTQLSLVPVNTSAGWHCLVVRYDPDTDDITAATELQVVTASFSASAASATPMALGSYRGLPTPSWRCPLLGVLEDAAAQALDPVATAVHAHRAWANLQQHGEELRHILQAGEAPDLYWAGSSIDGAGLQPLTLLNNGLLLACTLTRLAGPACLGLFGTCEWRAQDAAIGHLDLTSSALIVVGADIISFGAGLESLCGDRSGTGVSDAGWELGINTGGIPRFTVDDAGGAPVNLDLTAASSVAGKHAYLIRWSASDQSLTFVSEISASAASFAGRNPATANLFRFGPVRGLSGVAWDALMFAILYTNAFDALTAGQLLALAARVQAAI
jgi:hypothetical protein